MDRFVCVIRNVIAKSVEFFRDIHGTLGSILKFCVFVIVLNFVIIIELIICSDAKFSDFFKRNKVMVSTHETKHIVVDASNLREWGGIANLLESIINGVSKKRSNWSFVILCSPKLQDKFKFENSNVQTIPVELSSGGYLRTIRNVMNVLSFNLFHDQLSQLLFYNDIVFTKCDLFFDAYAAFSDNDYYTSKVSLIHDVIYLDIPSSFDDKFISLQKEAAPNIIKSSDKIITVSDFTKQRVIDSYNLKNKSIKTIPIKLAKRIQLEDESNCKEVLDKFSLKSKQYLIFTSIVKKHKNHKRLIQAFCKFAMKDINPNIKLVIVGSILKKDQQKLQLIIKSSFDNQKQYEQIKNRIVFTGFISDEELKILFNNALAMIYPSLYEGFGMPVIEAMSAGIPVACSKVASLPEIAGNASLFFDPYSIDGIVQVMEKIVNNKDLRDQLIKRGYNRAEYYSDTNSMIDAYIKEFEESMN